MVIYRGIFLTLAPDVLTRVTVRKYVPELIGNTNCADFAQNFQIDRKMF
jgi:hypothetical protein